jgi:hypothetical protein
VWVKGRIFVNDFNKPAYQPAAEALKIWRLLGKKGHSGSALDGHTSQEVAQGLKVA